MLARTPPAFRLLNNWEVERYFAQKQRDGTVTFRDRAYRFLASPASSVKSATFTALVLLLSITSIATFAQELTMQATSITEHMSSLTVAEAAAVTTPLDGDSTMLPTAWRNWNLFLVIIFVLELVVRVCVYPKPWRNTSLYIDALCILPLAVHMVVTRVHGASPLELYLKNMDAAAYFERTTMLVAGAVSFRMVKGMNFFLGTLVLKRTLRDSMTALLIPAYLLVMLFTFFGTVVFALEYDPRDVSGGGRVPDVASSWWMLLVTMTTVGYGDFSPQVSLL